ncbi:patched family-domain-containing protein [Podospora didyma]|uniref:Patched family-domain-containing protein n=1 Tax=Podospora didyma TaxID=330526 RepID=A0AAE0P7W1_9PEZI|nr:patched family-domain-containing protein [Podospora didyma]
MTKLSQLVAYGGLLLAGFGRAAPDDDEPPLEPFTPKHEAGRCAIRGHCGSKSVFGSQLPCVDNGLAEEPDEKLREQLTELCGPKWSSGPVCCVKDQVESLKSSLSTANQIISSCPACKDNFFNLFCTFTCSPDQSLFINVTKTLEKNGKILVTELDQLVSEKYGTGFYDSCKDVKFGPTNSKAMALIGGGAKNYTQLLKFLGQERFGGSPFQINFPVEYSEPEMAPKDMTPKKCNDDDPNFRCACIDCPAVCPELPTVEKAGSCHVGALPCLSFASIFTYSVLLFTLAVALVGHVAWRRHAKRKSERLRLLTDATPSDDEDEGDLTQNGAMFDRPQKTYIINTWCDASFSRLGHVAARFPAITIVTSFLCVIVLSLGWSNFQLEKDPARLWVSPSSPAAEEKAFFDKNFGAFYRAEKVFLVNDTNPLGPGPVLSQDTLIWWMSFEEEVLDIKGKTNGSSFEDLCLKPTGSACVVQTVSAYFQNNPRLVDDDWKRTLRNCAESPVECRPEYGQPLDPSMILGGYSDPEDPTTATAMTVTWVLINHPEGSEELNSAMDWEEALKNRLLDLQVEAKARGLRLSFSTEISLEQELNKSTNTDAKIIVISYIIMFLYASIALGSTTLSFRDFLRNPAISLVESKFTLGVAGILIVLMSITASIGLFSWAGLKATLIIIDVIPFIVLAVGVDNIFLIVHEFERVNISHPDEVVEVRVSRALGRMGPSILFSAITETISFALGAFVGMPAVRNFAIYAAGAVFINAILQVTMFVSVLTLNQIRVEDSRADCFPCVQVKSARIHLSSSNGNQGARYYEAPEESLLQRFIRKSYAPTLLGKKVKAVVIVIFLGIFAAGVALIPEVELGLDQRVAIPDDSYLIPYFNDLYDYFEAGPPVYFVTREFNGTERKHQQEICARYTTCQQMSLTNILEQERKRPEVSYISSPTASWIDDFFQWLNPDNDACCVVRRKPCFEKREPAWNITLSGMPEGAEFVQYLDKFLHSPTDEDCPLGGQASYGSAVVVDSDRDTILASHFRTSHSPLRSQEDFINAYASARRIANEVSAQTGLDVFPYSIFYVFFDQYATIVPLTATLLGSAVVIIFAVAAVLLGSVLTAAVVAVTVIMVIVDIIGAMALLGVSLNAVSLVNLIICVGIAVEFCAHIARAFMFPSRTFMERAKNRFRGRDARAWTALANVGGSVFSGITVTKILGVTVLAFTKSKIFEIYYFRVWLALVTFAATHALIFLPVALSLLGGEGYIDPESDGGLEEDLASRRYRALVPDGDTDSEDED